MDEIVDCTATSFAFSSIICLSEVTAKQRPTRKDNAGGAGPTKNTSTMDASGRFRQQIFAVAQPVDLFNVLLRVFVHLIRLVLSYLISVD